MRRLSSGLMSLHDRPSASERLIACAREVAALRARVAADPSTAARVADLKRWQARRLALTHADLLAEPRYSAAARFFLDDLYGAKDFSRRDAELERVLPRVVRVLPEAALATLADAVELDALSEDLDVELARVLAESGVRDLDEAAYATAYRSSATPAERERQLDLVLSIGRSLDRLVHAPLVGRLLRAMATPARLAGVPSMHDFLTRGFAAFRAIGSAADFLGRIDARERAVLRSLFAGQTVGWTERRMDC